MFIELIIVDIHFDPLPINHTPLLLKQQSLFYEFVSSEFLYILSKKCMGEFVTSETRKLIP